MQAEILEDNPEADIVVYAVWFNVLPSDNRSTWDPKRLTDPRVSQFWDTDQVIGRWYADNIGFSHGPLAWDVYYLYGPEATWEEIPSPLLSTGYTLFGQRSQLSQDFERLITE